MGTYIDADHIREMLETGQVESLPPSVSKTAEIFLVDRFPLRQATTIVDWDSLPSTVLQWNQVSDDEAVAWIVSKTLAGRCDDGLLLYSPSQPCLIGTIDFMIRHLDQLVWKAPGCRLLFGVKRSGDSVEFTAGLVEFNGKGELFASVEENETTVTLDSRH